MRRARHGMVLLEVMLGTAILGMAGVALIVLLTQTVETVRRARSAERSTVRASRLLNRATFWSTSELVVRLGRQRLDGWNIEVTMPRPQLYTLVVLDTLTGAAVLRTAVYRPVPFSAP